MKIIADNDNGPLTGIGIEIVTAAEERNKDTCETAYVDNFLPMLMIGNFTHMQDHVESILLEMGGPTPKIIKRLEDAMLDQTAKTHDFDEIVQNLTPLFASKFDAQTYFINYQMQAAVVQFVTEKSKLVQLQGSVNPEVIQQQAIAKDKIESAKNYITRTLIYGGGLSKVQTEQTFRLFEIEADKEVNKICGITSGLRR